MVLFACRVRFTHLLLQSGHGAGAQANFSRFKEVLRKPKSTSVTTLAQTMNVGLGTPQQALLVCYDAHR
jgi:hypothetical protein